MRVIQWSARAAVGLVFLIGPGFARAQSTLSLQQAVDLALASRPALKAEAERIAVAEALVYQAGAWSNPQLEFTNENLRPGQSYSTDVDTLAVVTQPLDVLGKRGRRIEAARQTAVRTAAEADVVRREVAREVKLAYWTARGAQERRDLLEASVANFQRIVDYHQSQLSVGTIPEHDVLRVRLEHEQRQVEAHMATVEAASARIALFRAMGRDDDPSVRLGEPLELDRPATSSSAERLELKVSKAAVQEALANASLQSANARPDLGVIVGYKRTLLPGGVHGANTAIVGVRITLPVWDRNNGNRQAAEAETRRQQQLLAETQADVHADLERARQEYNLRRAEVTDTLKPLREHATSLAGIARAASGNSAVRMAIRPNSPTSRTRRSSATVPPLGESICAIPQSSFMIGLVGFASAHAPLLAWLYHNREYHADTAANQVTLDHQE